MPGRDDHSGTRALAVIGDPVSQSLSPSFQNAAIAHAGLDLVYLKIRVPKSDLDAACRGMQALSFAGYNVTVPHKTDVIDLLDEVSEDARVIGAVNTVSFDEERRSIGHNTDWTGFLAALEARPFQLTERTKCVVFGSGGAARGIVYALAKRGGQLTIVARGGNADALIGSMACCRERSGVDGTTYGTPVAKAALVDADLVVSTVTPAGAPDVIRALEEAPVSRTGLVFDLVYTHGGVPAVVAWAGKNGRGAMDGREMLIQQGAGSFRIWTGVDMDVEVARGALDER